MKERGAHRARLQPDPNVAPLYERKKLQQPDLDVAPLYERLEFQRFVVRVDGGNRSQWEIDEI